MGVVMIPTLSLLLAPQIALTTTCGNTNDNKICHHDNPRILVTIFSNGISSSGTNGALY